MKKLRNALLVILGVSSLVFIMFQGLGDPTRMIIGQTGDKKTMDNIRKDLYLDQPVWKQYLLYLNDISPLAIHRSEDIEKKKLRGIFIGNNWKVGVKIPYLRKSYQTKQDVTNILSEAFPGTLLLAFSAMLFATLVGICLGIFSAFKKNTFVDNSLIISSIAGISAPSFFMALLVAYLFGWLLHNYTGLNIQGSWFEMNDITGEKVFSIKNLILPAITLGIRPLAMITQLTRSSMLDVLKQDYIRTAYAKGLSKRKVLFRHALRNALNPVITSITGWLAELLAGAFFVEYIFGWQGIGKLTVEGLEKLDYPLVMGAVLFSACLFVIINLLADQMYRRIDPRIK